MNTDLTASKQSDLGPYCLKYIVHIKISNAFKNIKQNLLCLLQKYILEEWQTSWNNIIGNKLLDIKPTIGEYQSVVRNIRREVVLA